MPLFEYGCPSCGHQFEYLIQPGETGPDICPSCQEAKPEKRISSFAVSVPSSCSASRGVEGPPPSCASGMCPFAQ